VDSVYPLQGEEAGPEPRLRVAPSRAPFPVTAFPNIPNARLLLPGDAEYVKYLPLHNRRNSLQPSRRILCSSTQAVADSINWVRGNGLQLAVRSGGHCYEGFSQSPGVVIDTRGMGLVTVDAAAKTVSVSAGASLGKIYKAVAAQGFAFAGGSCPTVGVAGHVLGGGFGLLGRRYGLACDNLITVRVVDANGVIHECDAVNQPDLYWAARGGGGGSFYIATRFTFRIHPISTVRTFKVAWKFPATASGLAHTAQVFGAWQQWAPSAPTSISSVMRISRAGDGRLSLDVIGQSTGSSAALTQQLNSNLIVRPPTTALSIVSRSFINAVNHFSGNTLNSTTYATTFMKAKSDVVAAPLAAAAITTLFQKILALPPGVPFVALCDAYGGAVASLAPGDTAFPHRGGSTYVIQYYSSWSAAAASTANITALNSIYQAMRPYMSGGAYVNYPDMDLPNPGFATAYWGPNLPRLKQIKNVIDPADFFKHGQSVPLP
jgi:FAD/FMN-containing dehydrogenase